MGTGPRHKIMSYRTHPLLVLRNTRASTLSSFRYKQFCTRYRQHSALIDAVMTQVADDSLESSYTSAAFHPDGLILGTGMHNSTVLVWEVRSQKVRLSTKIVGGLAELTAASAAHSGLPVLTTCGRGQLRRPAELDSLHDHLRVTRAMQPPAPHHRSQLSSATEPGKRGLGWHSSIWAPKPQHPETRALNPCSHAPSAAERGQV